MDPVLAALLVDGFAMAAIGVALWHFALNEAGGPDGTVYTWGGWLGWALVAFSIFTVVTLNTTSSIPLAILAGLVMAMAHLFAFRSLGSILISTPEIVGHLARVLYYIFMAGLPIFFVNPLIGLRFYDAVMMGPFLEELLYRVVAFHFLALLLARGARPTSRQILAAAATSSVLFALPHHVALYPPFILDDLTVGEALAGVFHKFAAGMVFAAAYAAGGLPASWLVHAASNYAVFFSGLGATGAAAAATIVVSLLAWNQSPLPGDPREVSRRDVRADPYRGVVEAVSRVVDASAQRIARSALRGGARGLVAAMRRYEDALLNALSSAAGAPVRRGHSPCGGVPVRGALTLGYVEIPGGYIVVGVADRLGAGKPKYGAIVSLLARLGDECVELARHDTSIGWAVAVGIEALVERLHLR